MYVCMYVHRYGIVLVLIGAVHRLDINTLICNPYRYRLQITCLCLCLCLCTSMYVRTYMGNMCRLVWFMQDHHGAVATLERTLNM